MLIAEAPAVAVNADNFSRAESDLYFTRTIQRAGGLGRFDHQRQIAPIDRQTAVRADRDTLSSAGVFDMDAGPVTITIPDAGRRFLSLTALDEDHYVVGVVYGAGRYTLSPDQAGTRYVMMAVRMFADHANPRDLEQVHTLQESVTASQRSQGRFEVPHWDQESQTAVRQALRMLAGAIPDTKRMFGSRDQVDAVQHLIGSATAWGANPERDAMGLAITPIRNDGSTIHRLTVRNVPVDGFWSITVYNSRGYMEPNRHDPCSLNSITARKAGDGSVTVQFGGSEGRIANGLSIMPGWNYWVRLYRPRPAIVDGSWVFPEAQPV